MFGQKQPPTPEEIRHQVSTAMLDVVGALQPIYDAADGIKRDLESRGWSPTMAEQAAGTWLCAALKTVMGGGG
ncbi:hypothetical protein ACIQMR_35305 [Streptomyces sp. NPDC091376]|uniref:hypothetical protein n=1 Tax=Streptomyces sp. NPDC091376 TaxID=3365994 RepID=UPI00381F83E9